MKLSDRDKKAKLQLTETSILTEKVRENERMLEKQKQRDRQTEGS